MIRTAIKFGLFVAVCLGFTAWLALTIGNITLFEDRYDLTATFADANGLLINDNVKVAGVVVGKVTGIKVEDGRARVAFKVREDVRVPADSSATIRWRNLLGQRFVYLEPGDAPTMLEDGDTVERTTSVVDLGELFNRLGPIVAAIDPQQVNKFLDAIVQALDGNEAKVQQIVADLGGFTSTLAERDEQIGRLVENLGTVTKTINDRDAQIRTMLDNLVLLASTFSANTDVLDQASKELGDFSEDVSFLMRNNRGELDRIVGNLDRIVQVVQAKLGTIDHALGGLDDAGTAIFASSRYGEWLNQVIPCGETGPPEDAKEPCADDGTGVPGGGPSQGGQSTDSEKGMGAVRNLMGLDR